MNFLELLFLLFILIIVFGYVILPKLEDRESDKRWEKERSSKEHSYRESIRPLADALFSVLQKSLKTNNRLMTDIKTVRVDRNEMTVVLMETGGFICTYKGLGYEITSDDTAWKIRILQDMMVERLGYNWTILEYTPPVGSPIRKIVKRSEQEQELAELKKKYEINRI